VRLDLERLGFDRVYSGFKKPTLPRNLDEFAVMRLWCEGAAVMGAMRERAEHSGALH
jgi:hypothetical protein